MFLPTENAAAGKIARQIVEVVAPERVYLLGAGSPFTSYQLIFMDAPLSVDGERHFYFVVIKGIYETHPNDVIQDMLEQRKGHATAMTALVFGLRQFEEWLLAGHPFALLVANKAELLYDARNWEAPFPAVVDPGIQVAGLLKDWLAYASSADSFLVAADLHRLRHEWNNCLFNTHQAAEQLYTGVILVCTGWRPATHNFDKLQRYARLVSREVAQLFPRDNEYEQTLFDILQKSYGITRYNKEYRAGEKETCELLKRVERLRHIATELVSPLVAATT